MGVVKTVSVVGLGKLGLCMTACFAKKYKVLGIDIDAKKVAMLNRDQNPVQETGLTRLLLKNKKNIRLTTDYKEAVLSSEVTFIVVATPSEADGSFSNEQLEESLREIGLILKDKKQRHLIVITSTVMPGTTEHVAKFILEEKSGKKCGKGFGLAYNPEFIALGSVIHDFLNPDFILIGEMNKEDGRILEDIYLKVCENKPRFARMNAVSAEIAKISLNCYVTMKITYANSLASLCERVCGADAHIITSSIGLDSRIGQKYLRPGLGYGGPCFPRDNVAFAAFARKLGEKAKLAETVDEVNRNQIRRIENLVKDLIVKNKKVKEKVLIGILGLSYKPHTAIIEDSQAVDIVELLINEGYKIIVYDPCALEAARGVFGDSVAYAKNSQECADKSDILLIATPWEEFKKINFSSLKKELCILDCWGLLKDKKIKRAVKYLGKGA